MAFATGRKTIFLCKHGTRELQMIKGLFTLYKVSGQMSAGCGKTMKLKFR